MTPVDIAHKFASRLGTTLTEQAAQQLASIFVRQEVSKGETLLAEGKSPATS